MMRLVNDSQEAPNLTLVYWPPFDGDRNLHAYSSFHGALDFFGDFLPRCKCVMAGVRSRSIIW